MMQLKYIKAIPHPMGNRIHLQWLNPRPDQFTCVRVMRRESTYSTKKHPGVTVADLKNKILFTVDLSYKDDLDSKTLSSDLLTNFLTHQMTLSTNAVVSIIEPGNRWEITDRDQVHLIIENNGELAVYGLSSAEDTGLRAEVIYYYTLSPYRCDTPGDISIDHGTRISALATGPYDFAGQMYRMLPTIYHRYDTALHLRRFLDLPGFHLDQFYSFANAALDFHNINRVDGKFLPLLAQWIGWIIDSYDVDINGQRNELKKAPALYQTIGIIPTIEAAIVKCMGGWKSRTKEFVHNVFLSNQPERLNLWICQQNASGQWQESKEVFSLDSAYEGRPAAAWDNENTLWLFYHTQRNRRWDIWFKTYKENQGWSPSQPFTASGTVNKYPTAALQGESLWVSWSSYNETNQTWELQYRKRTAGEWVDMDKLEDKDKLPVTGNQRKSPQAIVDQQNHFWLFWLEKTANQWQLKYNRHNGETWELTSVNFPDDEGEKPRVEKDLFVLYQPADTNIDDSIWVFWAQKKQSNGRRGSWEIAYRQKSGTVSLENEWGTIDHLAKVSISPVNPDIEYHDCEPAAIVNKDNEIEFFWVSNRTGRSRAIWTIKLMDIAPDNIDNAKLVINNPYSQRTPLPLLMDSRLLLLYRSTGSITYQSDLYKATQTTDFRYAGCVTADTHNKARNARRGMYDDFQTYTYDTGEDGVLSNNDWYARDTIGLYLTPDTEDAKSLIENQEVIKGILERFLPIQNRAVFVLEPPVYREMVYTYDFPEEDFQRFINEQFFDSTLPEVVPGVSEQYQDEAPGWIWLCSWSEDTTGHGSVNFNASPIDTKFRTWHTGINKSFCGGSRGAVFSKRAPLAAGGKNRR